MIVMRARFPSTVKSTAPSRGRGVTTILGQAALSPRRFRFFIA